MSESGNSHKRKNSSSTMGCVSSRCLSPSDEEKPPKFAKIPDDQPDSPPKNGDLATSSHAIEEVKRHAGAGDAPEPSIPVEAASDSPDAPPKLEAEEDLPPLDDTPASSNHSSPKSVGAAPIETEKLVEPLSKEKVVKEEPAAKKPKRRTIADLGYHFKDGKLRTLEGDGGFTFTTQKAYEELGDLIADDVYDMMEERGVTKQYLQKGNNRRFYFASPEFETKDRVLFLIHGSGVVKAGQWARKLIINESISRGTQLDYIDRALAKDWGVVVLNYNEHCVGKELRCHSPDAHAHAEWEHALERVRRAEQEILVIAHSYGGAVVSDMVKTMRKEGDLRVSFVGLTDSWFSKGESVPAVNWRTEPRALSKDAGGVWQMWSGDKTHEGTSAAAIDGVFHVLERIRKEGMDKEELIELLSESEKIVRKAAHGRDAAERENRKKKREVKDSESESSRSADEDSDEGVGKDSDSR